MHKDKAMERNEILRNLALETTWIDLEGIILSEIRNTEKHKHCMIFLISEIVFFFFLKKLKETENRLMVPRSRK